MEEHEERLRTLEKDFLNIVEEIDKSHLRKMQGDMLRCAAQCCDNQSYSMERTQNCIDNCSVAVQNAQQFVQSEISRLQSRWGRCIMECNDKMRDSSSPGESSSKLVKDFGACSSECMNTQYNLMKIARTNIDRVLSSGKYKNEQIL